MEQFQTLPPPSQLSHSALSFLDHKFQTERALTESPSFVDELQTQCSELDRTLAELNRRLGEGLAAYASFSGEIHGIFGGVNTRMNALSSTCSSSVLPGSIMALTWQFFILGFSGVLILSNCYCFV